MQNCILTSSLATRFTAAPELISAAYKKTPFGTENWAYPYLTYGEPCSDFYGEIWTTGMDWTLDLWLVYVNKFHDPRAELVMSFQDNTKVINDYDLKDVLRGILSQFSRMGEWGWDTMKFINTFPSGGPQEVNGEYGRFFFRHASQSPVDFWMNMKFYEVIKSVVG